MENLTKEQEIIKLIFKDFLVMYNSRSISKVIEISHAGAFKILKKLEKRNIVESKEIGRAKIYSLNMKNPVTVKEIETILTIEAQKNKIWLEEFKELDKKSKIVILYGSIIKDEKNAKDIDLLIVANKNKFKDIKGIIEERNKFLNKKIHPIIQTLSELKRDINKKNKVLVEIIKTGFVLFGQDELVNSLL